MASTKPPSALDLLNTIEGKGCALTLEARGTAQKWVTGQNLFMGLQDRCGLTIRNAYGPISIEMPLHVRNKLDWQAEDGTQVTGLPQALIITVKRGLVRRGSHIYNALSTLALLAR
jgi:hypothetical protein